MRKIMYELEIGYAGCSEEGELEVDENLTKDEIDAMVHEMALEHASSWEGDERLCWDSEMSDEEFQEATTYFYENVYGSWRWMEAEDEE